MADRAKQRLEAAAELKTIFEKYGKNNRIKKSDEQKKKKEEKEGRKEEKNGGEAMKKNLMKKKKFQAGQRRKSLEKKIESQVTWKDLLLRKNPGCGRSEKCVCL